MLLALQSRQVFSRRFILSLNPQLRMISFVNAKINIGLYVTGRRANGYHDLSTVLYPIGKLSGSPESPWPFSRHSGNNTA